MSYAILLNELMPLDLEKTARILAKAQNILYADATRSVRNCCGILAQGLTFQEARLISVELNREGVGVFHMEESKMYRPEPALSIHNADCLEQCFNVEDIYGRDHPLAWGNIILISVGLTGEGDLILDVFSKQPQKTHYRIRHNQFNYDYLGQRLRRSALENFRVLVEDVVRFGNQAYGNRGINAYLSGKEPEKMNYRSLEFFDKENFWLLQLIHESNSSSEEKE